MPPHTFDPDGAIRQRERSFAAAGIQEAVLEIPDQSRDEILKVLDKYAPLLG